MQKDVTTQSFKRHKETSLLKMQLQHARGLDQHFNLHQGSKTIYNITTKYVVITAYN